MTCAYLDIKVGTSYCYIHYSNINRFDFLLSDVIGYLNNLFKYVEMLLLQVLLKNSYDSPKQ